VSGKPITRLPGELEFALVRVIHQGQNVPPVKSFLPFSKKNFCMHAGVLVYFYVTTVRDGKCSRSSKSITIVFEGTEREGTPRGATSRPVSSKQKAKSGFVAQTKLN
jgi:hypothetical protein